MAMVPLTVAATASLRASWAESRVAWRLIGKPPAASSPTDPLALSVPRPARPVRLVISSRAWVKRARMAMLEITVP